MIIIQRRVEKYINGKWVDIKFEDLKNDDIFKLFESTNEPVLGLKEFTVFYATSDAYINKDNIWCIDTKENQRYEKCEICEKPVHPLDAHFGRLKGELITAHIDCWNKAIKGTE